MARRQLDELDELLRVSRFGLTSARRRFPAASGLSSGWRLDRQVGGCFGFEWTESDGGG